MRRRLNFWKPVVVLVTSAACTVLVLSRDCQAQSTTVDARTDTVALARQLGSVDPKVRRAAAESLARLAAVDQRKVVEGYRLQEKDKKVRLALDWALYRMGKSEALFQLVHELDSSRHKQAVSYLSQVDSPSLLYVFLKNEDNQPPVTVGLLESLSRIGDEETLEQIKPFRKSFYPGVAEAAEMATEQIENRLAQNDNLLPSRPRTIEKTTP
ncbi:MAG TPA: hypothetical protein VJ124_18040 [Pyrinomonadaceae bacterium]|nr:hypothetical protein [Pyrinomonadaceae bacterium]